MEWLNPGHSKRKSAGDPVTDTHMGKSPKFDPDGLAANAENKAPEKRITGDPTRTTSTLEPLKLHKKDQDDASTFCFCMNRIFLIAVGVGTIILLVLALSVSSISIADDVQVVEEHAFEGAYPVMIATAILLGLANVALIIGACLRHKCLIRTYKVAATVFTLAFIVLVSVCCYSVGKSADAEHAAVFIGVAIGAFLIPITILYVIVMIASCRYIDSLSENEPK